MGRWVQQRCREDGTVFGYGAAAINRPRPISKSAARLRPAHGVEGLGGGAAAARPAPYTKKPRPGLGFLDGAKETRTPDPLHAMQVLYQLSYGPIAASAVGDCRDVVHHTRPASRQTPTSRPWMVTWSAGSSRGA